MIDEVEVWKEVKDYERYYKVSNLGRILSVRTGKILKQNISRFGYSRIELNVNGTAKKHLVHRLVAFAFIPEVKDKPHVNHLDNNRSHNIVENLEWCTVKENINYASSQGRLNDVKGIKNANAFLKEDQVLEIRRLAATNQFKQCEIAMLFGLDEKHVSLIVLRKRWKHI